MAEFYIEYISGQFYLRLYFVISLLIAEILFMRPYVLRKRKALRISLSVVAYLVVGLLFPECILPLNNIVTLLIFAVSVPLAYACFDYSFVKILFNCIGAYAAQNIAVNISQILQIACNITSTAWFLVLEFAVMAIVYALAYFTLTRHNKPDYSFDMKNVAVLIISVVVLLITNVLMNCFRMVGLAENLLCRTTLLICSILALLFLYVTSGMSSLASEKELMKKLLEKEQEQYKISRDVIDLINVKCHDMKHTIEQIQSEGQMSDVADAIALYDSVLRTGNVALDSVLTSKNLRCVKHDIRTTFLIDGNLLSFMASQDIYSLFGNLLDNAIERELKESPDLRYISLNMVKAGEMLNICVENYCSDERTFDSDGVPVTDKKDKQWHGFGTRSILFIAEKYGGHVRFKHVNDLFTVNVLLPARKLSA